MPKPVKKEKKETPVETPEVVEIVVEEKPKPLPPKPPISRSGPVFPNANQFRGGQSNNINNNRQRPGRAANRGR
ncbi:MAG: hypothetical protein Q8K26_01105 [Candidatus Gracilibacteria bacterium]|nr:hypothetical protein [Candidatus Gracilibacteria bacterium]